MTMNKNKLRLIALLITVLGSAWAIANAESNADGGGIVGVGDYVVTVDNPTYKEGEGPKVFLDEGHNNYQTIADRYMGFAQALEADGASVSPFREKFTAQSLAQVDVLVICNALNDKNAKEKKEINKWKLPTPSAFTPAEIEAVHAWVKAGGSLLLIADHMPFPGAATEMASGFGVVMQNNFAFDAAFTYKPGDMNLMTYYKKPPKPSVGKLFKHKISHGIDHVVTFTGSGFRMKPGIKHARILQLGEGSNTAWPTDHVDISMSTPFSAGVGLLQGATLPYGKGKVGVFGEASMFSVNYAFWADNYPLGFHNPEAADNQQFLLNVIHWLAK